jgi:DNA-directed RNA polymerase subunit RPC12/RpoP
MNYYTCPVCGAEFDPYEAYIEYPDAYLECECGYELSQDFYDDLIENWMCSMEGYGEDR